MGATCSHTLMRAAEVLDLMDCGEAIITPRWRGETPTMSVPTSPSPARSLRTSSSPWARRR
ncbi:MAG: hypothetical protein ACLR7Z_12345 [Bilophila wadsworthia]